MRQVTMTDRWRCEATVEGCKGGQSSSLPNMEFGIGICSKRDAEVGGIPVASQPRPSGLKHCK
jgi:hypothetical protein